MIDEPMKQTLYEAQEMFRLHGEMRPIFFMKLLNVEEMVIEYPDMDTPQGNAESITKIKTQIESSAKEITSTIDALEKDIKTF